MKEKKVTKEHVHVAVPTMNDAVGLSVAAFCSQLDRLSLDPRVPWYFSWQFLHGRRPVEWARNLLVQSFLESDADKLWFLDTDMMPPANCFELLKVDADIVGGLAFAFNHQQKDLSRGMKVCVFHYNLNKDNCFNPVIPTPHTPRIMDVDAIGTATMVVRRRVLEDKRMWVGDGYTDLGGKERKLSTDKDAPPPIFRTLYKPNGEILRGEDLDFCIRAKQLGYSIKADFGVRYGHVKPINLDEVASMMMDVVARAKKFSTVKGNTDGQGQVEGQDEQGPEQEAGDGHGRAGSSGGSLGAAGAVRLLQRNEGAAGQQGGGLASGGQVHAVPRRQEEKAAVVGG